MTTQLRTILAVTAVAAIAATSCGSSGGGGSVEAFCERLAEFQAREGEFQNAFEDPEQLDEAVDAVDGIADAAPDEIRDDAKVVADGFRDLADAFSDIDPDDPDAALEAFEDVDEQLAEVEEASAAVEAYAAENCGLDLSGEGG